MAQVSQSETGAARGREVGAGGGAGVVRRVAELMSWALLSVPVTASCGEARRAMDARSVQHLPILEGNVLVGMVCSCDLWSAASSATGIAEVMRSGVVTVRADSLTPEAVRLMVQHDVGALPVLYHGFLIGILTAGDLERAKAAPAGLRASCRRCGGHHHVRGEPATSICVTCWKRDMRKELMAGGGRRLGG